MGANVRLDNVGKGRVLTSGWGLGELGDRSYDLNLGGVLMPVLSKLVRLTLLRLLYTSAFGRDGLGAIALLEILGLDMTSAVLIISFVTAEDVRKLLTNSSWNGTTFKIVLSSHGIRVWRAHV